MCIRDSSQTGIDYILTSSSRKVFQVLFGVLGLHMRTDDLQIDGIEKFLQSFGRVTAMQTIEDPVSYTHLRLFHNRRRQK